MKICIVMPTYNEVNTITGLIREIHKQNFELVVIDDGSGDNTAQVAKDNGAIVLQNEFNQGKGASLIKGFNYALNEGFDAVITLDGDGQHEPLDIPYFIRLAEYSNSGIVIGNRINKIKNMPLLRLLTNKFMSWFISMLAKQKIPDSQCGFRLIKKEVLNKVKLMTRKYETESELLIKAARLGYKIESVPIKTIYIGKKSQIHPFLDTVRFIRFIAKELWIMPS